MIQIQPREHVPDGYYWLRYANAEVSPEVVRVREGRVCMAGHLSSGNMDDFLSSIRTISPPPVLVPIPKPPLHPATV